MLKTLILSSLLAFAYAGPTTTSRTETVDCAVLKECSFCQKYETCQWSEDRSCTPFDGQNKEMRNKVCFNESSSGLNGSATTPPLNDEAPVEIEENPQMNVSTIIPTEEDESLTTVAGGNPDTKRNQKNDSDGEADSTPPTPSAPSSTTPKTTPVRPITTTSSIEIPTTTSSTTDAPTTSSTTTTTFETTTTSTTSTTTSSTTAPSVDPEDKSSFDGWSFFGGILLTLGFFAIGFVGLKYYRVRSRTDADYNRF